MAAGVVAGQVANNEVQQAVARLQQPLLADLLSATVRRRLRVCPLFFLLIQSVRRDDYYLLLITCFSIITTTTTINTHK